MPARRLAELSGWNDAKAGHEEPGSGRAGTACRKKAWWKQYGSLVVTAILLVALAFSGWQGWRYWQSSNRRRRATCTSLWPGGAEGDAKPCATRTALLERFGGTRYAALGALLAGNTTSTGAEGWRGRSSDRSSNAAIRQRKDSARLRLANVLLDEKAYDEALKRLDAAHGVAFDAQFAVTRGDILVAKNQRDEAKSAYRLALEKSDPKSGGFRESVTMRLDALGG